MMAYFNASGVSGIERILELVGFESLIEGADLIVTGEGKSDLQTLGGKVWWNRAVKPKKSLLPAWCFATAKWNSVKGRRSLLEK